MEYYPTVSQLKETCLLCKRTWSGHVGWLCDTDPDRVAQYASVRLDITKIPREFRFWTYSMREAATRGDYNQLTWHVTHNVSKAPTSDIPVTLEVEPEWRKWQHKAPGECPCGIHRSRCDYHR